MSKPATSPPSQTDWARVDALTDAELDLSDVPEVEPGKFARALVRKGLQPVPRKTLMTLRLDADLIEWFRSRGRGYQSKINAILRAYKEACEEVGRA